MIFDDHERPLVVGHRGARGLYPENTITGFSQAISLGVDALELDVAVTADRVVVVTHDPCLNTDIVRGPDGNWLVPPTPLVRKLTFAQLCDYDVGRLRPGSADAAQFPDQRAVDGALIPSLREVLAATSHVPLLIEIKTFPDQPELTVAPVEMAELVMDVLSAGQAIPRAMILSFDWKALRYLRGVHPEIATGWLTQKMSEEERRLWWGEEPATRHCLSAAQTIADQGGQWWLPEWCELQRDDIAVARQVGSRVLPWGVERPDEMDRAVDWGVEGLITDRPDIALKISGGWKRLAAPT
jgi:glycerophosphoryl diester phosphodiesterase